jgi:hypothetical protein
MPVGSEALAARRRQASVTTSIADLRTEIQMLRAQLDLNPRGVPVGGWDEITSSTGSVGGTPTDTGLECTFEAIPGRLYQYTCEGLALLSGGATGDVMQMLLTDGAGVAVDNMQTGVAVGANAQAWFSILHHESFDTSGPVTRKIQIVRNTGAGTVVLFASATYRVQLVVIDIGPDRIP